MPAGSTYTPIATTSPSGVSTVSFTSIPSTYTDLILIFTLQSNAAGSGVSQARLQLNSDTGTNYSDTILYGTGSSALSTRDTNSNVGYVGYLAQASNSGRPPSIVHFMNYSNTTTYKTILSRNNDANNQVSAQVNLWRSTAAINRIDLFLSGQTLSGIATLYGIASA